MKIQQKNILSNTASLYLMNIAKLIFPLITLPYLTRVLSTDCYGVVTYVKACMTYVQLLLDFGFILSAVKDIVEHKDNKEEIGKITGDVIVAKIMLSVIALAAIISAAAVIELLRTNILFTMLSFLAVFVTAFLLDFLFRGIEKMHVIAIAFVAMKTISTVLTLLLVKTDADILYIPILDIAGSLVAIVINLVFVKKYGIKISFGGIKSSIEKIKISWTYFISNMATTAFSVLNTVLIGIYINETDVAFWGVSLQIISAAQNLYTPINNGIYPQMIQSKDIGIVKKVLSIFMPLVLIASALTYVFAEPLITIISGAKYAGAVPVFRTLIPVLVFSFPGMLLGWPALGAIGRVKETTRTTVVTCIVQIAGLAVLIMAGKFTIITVALYRCVCEALLMILRLYYCVKYKAEFVK